jgi:hypothetical protein
VIGSGWTWSVPSIVHRSLRPRIEKFNDGVRVSIQPRRASTRNCSKSAAFQYFTRSELVMAHAGVVAVTHAALHI